MSEGNRMSEVRQTKDGGWIVGGLETTVTYEGPGFIHKKDALLVAARNDMLEALVEIRQRLKKGGESVRGFKYPSDYGALVVMADRAIKKANGEQ